MSKPTWLRILAGTVSFLQVVNAGLSSLHPNPLVALFVAAALMGLQTVINESSLSTVPPR